MNTSVAPAEALRSRWEASPVVVCKTAPTITSSVHVGKDGVQTHVAEGWTPYWRLKVFTNEEKEKGPAKKPSDNYFVEAKEQLTAWWLKLVEENVDAYLTQQWGFDFAAIPYHYIDQPPKSLPDIKRNLDIVHSILSSLAPPGQPGETVEGNNRRRQVRHHLHTILFTPVTGVVYKAIDSYSHGVKTYLWHECHEELDRYDFSMSELFFNDATTPRLEDVFVAFRDRKERETLKYTRGTFFTEGHNVDNNRKVEELKEQVAYVESLVHEMWYIREMKRLEKGFFTLEGTINPDNKPGGTFLGAPADPKSSSVSDIVPVSGLILSKLHRLENELKTILEHWGRRRK